MQNTQTHEAPGLSVRSVKSDSPIDRKQPPETRDPRDPLIQSETSEGVSETHSLELFL